MQQKNNKIRVAIADDHEMVRSALRLMLEKSVPVEVVLEASSLTDLFKKAKRVSFDVLLLDLNLADSSGIATIERVRKTFELPAILVLSAYPEHEFALRAFQAGANGYLHKSASSKELLEAFNTLAQRKNYITASLKNVLPLDIGSVPETHATITKLSKRELEVLRMIAAGINNKDIAARLGVSPKTVSTYKTRMIEKLGLDSAIQLHIFALEHLPL